MAKCRKFGSPLYNPNTYAKAIDRMGNTDGGLVRILIDTPVRAYRPDGSTLEFPNQTVSQPKGVSTRASDICLPSDYGCNCH